MNIIIVDGGSQVKEFFVFSFLSSLRAALLQLAPPACRSSH